MRVVLANELDNIMKINDKIVILDADLARPNGTLGLYEKYPDRTIDVGIAEQNMTSVAAGMSAYGFIPFIFSFTPFSSRRICDQIAISVAYAKQNVKIIGADPGIAAELNGGTHMSFEDIGVLRSIPGIVIFEPVDEFQLSKAIPQLVDYYGPVYIRLFRKELPKVFNENYEFDLFKNDILQEGTDITIACTGLMVQEVMEANKQLLESGIHAEIINVHTLKPLEEESILRSVKKTHSILTVENHNIIGGLRSAVAEKLTEHNIPCIMRYIGIQDQFGRVGKMQDLKEFYGLRVEDIINQVESILSIKNNL